MHKFSDSKAGNSAKKVSVNVQQIDLGINTKRKEALKIIRDTLIEMSQDEAEYYEQINYGAIYTSRESNRQAHISRINRNQLSDGKSATKHPKVKLKLILRADTI